MEIPSPAYNGESPIVNANELQPGEVRIGNVRMFPKGDKFHFIHEDAVARAELEYRKEYDRKKLLRDFWTVVAIAAMFFASAVYLTLHFKG